MHSCMHIYINNQSYIYIYIFLQSTCSETGNALFYFLICSSLRVCAISRHLRCSFVFQKFLPPNCVCNCLFRHHRGFKSIDSKNPIDRSMDSLDQPSRPLCTLPTLVFPVVCTKCSFHSAAAGRTRCCHTHRQPPPSLIVHHILTVVIHCTGHLQSMSSHSVAVHHHCQCLLTSLATFLSPDSLVVQIKKQSYLKTKLCLVLLQPIIVLIGFSCGLAFTRCRPCRPYLIFFFHLCSTLVSVCMSQSCFTTFQHFSFHFHDNLL